MRGAVARGVLCAQGDVRVFEGHAFIVEAAVSIGGRDMKPGGWGGHQGMGKVPDQPEYCTHFRTEP